MARALERQRDEGGALDTALLELGLLPEDAIVAGLARASELPAARREAYAAADPRARRVFPSKVAERHGLAPLALDGRELELVAVYPVDMALVDEISFMLSLHLAPRVGPEFRVRGLIHRLYGTELSSRLEAVAAAYDAQDAPPVAPTPAPAEEAPAADGAAAAAEADPREREPEAPAAAGDAAAPGAEVPAAEGPEEPLAAALAQAVEAAEVPLLAEEPAAAGEEPAAAAPDRSAPTRWTVEEARATLASASGRDDVVLAALRYARDFFEHAAVFAVTRDAVAGHDALGAEEDARERCRATALYSTEPGIFRTAVEAKSPYLGPVSRDAPGNSAVLDGLGRGTPRTVLVFPVLMRDRAVCILYADNGEAPVSARRLGDLLLFLGGLGPAFERIVRERKARSRRARAATAAEPPPPPPEEPPPAPEAAAPPEPRPAAPERAAAPAPAAPPPAPPAPPPSAPAAVEIEIDVAESTPLPVPGPDPARVADALVDTVPGSPMRQRLLERLAAAGAEAAAALCARLPGPLEVAPEALDATPPEAQGPILAALIAVGGPASRAVAQVLADPDPARRRAAAAVLARVAEASSYAALAERAFDADPSVARAAVAALAAHRRDPKMRPVPEKLRRALHSGLGNKPARAATALGALRDAESIPGLIQVLESADREAGEAAAEALARITLQRLGPDARRWLGWWKENRGRGRADWLFSALASEDRAVRVAAAEELGEAGETPVAYSPDLPAGEREKAARAWASWWARSGRAI
jgi:HEAT repeat protein